MLRVLYSHLSLQAVIWSIVLLPLVGALLAGIIAAATARSDRPAGRAAVTAIAIVAAGLALAAAIVVATTLVGFEIGALAAITGPLFTWIVLPGVVVEVGLKVDALSLVLSLAVALLGFLTVVAAAGGGVRDATHARFRALLLFALAALQLIVLAENLVLLLAGWEAAGIAAALLVAHHMDAEGGRAALRMVAVDRIGTMALVALLFLVYGVMRAAGAPPTLFALDAIERFGATFIPVAPWIAALLFAAAIARAAQLPFCFWLPGASVAPAPAAALLFGGALVAAGIVLLARLDFVLAMSPAVLRTAAAIGALTALAGGAMALVENDLRRLVASLVLAQLGFAMLAAGMGALSVAIVQLLVTAFAGALLFLAAGAVVRRLDGECDVRAMGGLKPRMPVSAWGFTCGAAACAGIPPIAGFFGKEAVLGQAFERGHYGLWIIAFAAVGLSAFAAFRAAGAVFFGDTSVAGERYKRIVDAPVSVLVPVMLLTTIVALGGFLFLPQTLGGTNWLGSWIGKVVAYEVSRAPGEGGATAIVLMVVTALWSLHFSVLGWIIYAQKREWHQRAAARIRRLAGASQRLPERLPELFIARPIAWLGDVVVRRFLEGIVVQGILVEGTGRVVRAFGILAAAGERGAVHHLRLILLVAAVCVIAYLTLWRS